MCRRRTSGWQALVLTCLALITFGPTASAYAAEWLPPVARPRIVLGYGVAYPGGTHRGVDLAAAAGSAVAAPEGGRVLFAGSVPADGGGTRLALSLETADGLRISLSPLQRVAAVEGDTVAAGQQVGFVDGAGDDSSAGAHLHLSVRRGETYLDPTGMLALAPSGTSSAASAPQASVPPVSPARPSASPAGYAAASVAPASVAAAAATGAVPITVPAPRSHVELVRSPSVVEAGIPSPSTLDPTALWPDQRALTPGLGAPAALPFAGALLTAVGVLGVGLVTKHQLAADPVH